MVVVNVVDGKILSVHVCVHLYEFVGLSGYHTWKTAKATAVAKRVVASPIKKYRHFETGVCVCGEEKRNVTYHKKVSVTR